MASPPARIKTLQSYLDPQNPDYQPEAQHTNICAAIKLYEEGKIDGTRHVTITDGKVGSLQAAFKSTSRSWDEVCSGLVLSSQHPHITKHALGDALSTCADGLRSTMFVLDP